MIRNALNFSPFLIFREKEDNWIGWHNDSGFLTALTSAIFVNDETAEVCILHCRLLFSPSSPLRLRLLLLFLLFFFF